jgi:AcrR family transcriptional regulator
MSDKKTRSLQRVVDMAVEAFRSDRLRDMSINVIAKEARCSTATIYEVFGSKWQLYRIAAKASIERGDHPRIEESTQQGSIEKLFGFCEARIVHLASHERGRGEHLLNSRADISGGDMRDYVQRQLSYIREAVEGPVRRAIDEGLLLPFDVAAHVHAIISGTGFGPMVTGNYQLDPDCNWQTTLRLTFAPLLTAEGQVALEAFVARRWAEAVDAADEEKARLH